MAAKKKVIHDYVGDPPREIKGREDFYGFELDEYQLKFANAIWDPNIDIVFVNARAGSGKTQIATGMAYLLVKYGFFDSIVYIMSPYGEKKQGWLPGSITEKSSVYFEAFYQALIKCGGNPYTDIKTTSLADQKNGTGFITCITDTFLRGSTLDNAVVIIDESQNYTTSQLKTVLTRIGGRSKVIVIGHDLQCDLEDPTKSGFKSYIEHFKGQERAEFCDLVNNYRGWISRHADDLD